MPARSGRRLRPGIPKTWRRQLMETVPEEGMLTLTDAASRKIAEIMSKQTNPWRGWRVFVEKGGCSGYPTDVDGGPDRRRRLVGSSAASR
jgi:hypothetical protein